MHFRHKLLFLAITTGTLALAGCDDTVGKGSSASSGAACLTATGCSGGTVSAACTTTTCSGTITTGCATATGCSGTGGGEDDDEAEDRRRNGTLTLAITPSLGQVQYATINIYDASRQLLASGDSGDAGGFVVDAAFDMPVLVEVAGDGNAAYFDEAAGTTLPFANGTLHALAPTGSTQVGVTVLTEIAWQLLNHSGAPMTNTNVLLANEAVRRALAPDLASIVAPPLPWTSTTTTGSLPGTDAGEYALLLGAFARLGAGDATPALSTVAQLDADLADGLLDGLAPSAGSVVPKYASTAELAAALKLNVNDLAAIYGNAALQQRVNGMVDRLTFDIAPPAFTGGG